MAYFPNGTSGLVFDEQCMRCRYGNAPCPIALVQMEYNYEACNNEVARKILDDLVRNDGTCAMFVQFREDLEISVESQLLPGIEPVMRKSRVAWLKVPNT